MLPTGVAPRDRGRARQTTYHCNRTDERKKLVAIWSESEQNSRSYGGIGEILVSKSQKNHPVNHNFLVFGAVQKWIGALDGAQMGASDEYKH